MQFPDASRYSSLSHPLELKADGLLSVILVEAHELVKLPE